MSFILDALRKSENARHREVTPALAEIRVVRRESRLPWVLAVLGVLLFVNALVLLALYLRHEPAAPPPAAAAGGAPAATATAAPARRPGAARPGVRSLSEEAAAAAPVYLEPPPLARPPAAGRVAAPDAGAERAVEPAPRVRRGSGDSALDAAVAAQQQAAVDAAPGGIKNGGSVPRLNELGPQATAGLPALNLDLHVYASEPANRFVILNGRRYGEGARTGEGLVVEHITPDGAILNNRGVRFLLPRD
jgi:general secretion pathway protein B